MYLLDTNILSELMRQQPNPQVLEWLDQQDVESMAISSITIAEIKLGIALLPNGKRKSLLAKLATEMFQEFAGNQYSFNTKCTDFYADIVAACTKQGRGVSTEDAQIASIAYVHNIVLVTRNLRDFEMMEGLELFNPFR